ncbi:DEAD/DEAH box helicase [Alkalibaculum sp. M08DMB]|uniref:DEAD/DEAH box helicase n=1 Tax=Alkalibaculum sporogenes TaxID=2655001 RepID=A0A6A7KDG7_9FIRM|nr:DEAD/DEAH box helicase [Alkalibaculum sporogenes]MPW27063.1 DEAD/DEAH box helicase [Alkalibaculum sporogenes]
MLVESNSKYLLKKARAKAKMIEYNVPEELHIKVEKTAEDLFLIAVAAIGNMSVDILSKEKGIEEITNKYKSVLEFSSKYFDSYLNAQLDEGADDYYLLLGAVAYFLCDYIGSSKVLINKLDIRYLNLGANSIENALAALLQDKFERCKVVSLHKEYNYYLELLQREFQVFFKTGKYPSDYNIKAFRKMIYGGGTDLELLLVDAFCAIYYLKTYNSAINLLPKYTRLNIKILHDVVFNGCLIKELWPSQKQLGEKGIFAGKSGVIQMPTSSGKTKSISIIIASAFLSERTSLGIVVAPFRALCREISNDLENDFKFNKNVHIDELSDVLQKEELSIDKYSANEKAVIIATPEKLIYLLRQRTDLIEKIGLIVFDEGHLFDEPGRGIVYELLISTIKEYLPLDIQKILISAIIPNAKELNDWLNGESGIVISDNTIKSTEKTIAFTDWSKSEQKSFGYLYFINPENPEEEEFYVPRLIPITELGKLSNERKIRIFPEVDFKKSKVLNNDIAIYYGLTLCKNGGVVIFCGKKDTANSILKRILVLESRGYNIGSLLENASLEEVGRISKLIEENYGKENDYFLSANRAAFVHHSGISNGIKIAIESAMKKGYINFLICTSTLAQGVNLPIRYLVISNMYQGKDQIRVRDFQNLIGRAGRSGLFTEGSILLTETFVYNKRNSYYSKAGYKWREYKHFIDNNNSEACSSRILFLVKPCTFKNNYTLDMKKIINSYYSTNDLFPQKYKNYLQKIKIEHPQLYNDIKFVIDQTLSSLGAIESFLMSYLQENTWVECEDRIHSVLKNTLAYHLATLEEKESLIEIFDVIGKYCIENVRDTYERYVYSRSLLSVKKMLYIQSWVNENLDEIIVCDSTDMLLSYVFMVIEKVYDNKIVNNIEFVECILNIGLMWKNGNSYFDILTYSQKEEFQILKRGKLRNFDLDDIIKICDSVLSYDSTVIISAIGEVVSSKVEELHQINKVFRQLNNELKYGLEYGTAIILYDLGFSDRVISQKISEFFTSNKINIFSKENAKKQLIKHYDFIEQILDDYPSVFKDRLFNLL